MRNPEADYKKAKAAKIGVSVRCPTCGDQFEKRSYQHVFCSNRGVGNCKDRYWNEVNPRGIALYCH